MKVLPSKKYKCSNYIMSDSGGFDCREVLTIHREGNTVIMVLRGCNFPIQNNYATKEIAQKVIDLFKLWKKERELEGGL